MIKSKVKSVVWVLVAYLMTGLVYSVTVVDQSKEEASGFGGGLFTLILTFLVIAFIGVGIIALIVMFLVRLYKKLSDYKRRNKDFLYYDFEYQVSQLHINSDPQLKYRNPRRFWIFWKRMPVYVDTEDEGYKFIGYYNGEGYKKEDFYMIGLYNKLGLFKYINQIVIIPFKIKKSVKKIYVDKKKAMIIKAEGIDNVGNTDYYFIPLIRDKSNADKEFIDFADYVHKNFFESIIYRDVIKTNLEQYREGVIKSVETNPNIHFKRRGD